MGTMSKVYRLLAVALVLLGFLVIFWTVQATISDVMNTYSPSAIKCDARGCRSILDDGTLADDEVSRPDGGTR